MLNTMRKTLRLIALAGLLAGCAAAQAEEAGREWIAGDHHVHSRFSGKFAKTPEDDDGPTYVLGADGIYPIPVNAAMARRFGLGWMAAIDHGGLGLSRLRFEQAYPELLQSRRAVPEVIQFHGMELDTPGGDHSSLIMPLSEHEREDLLALETAYAKHEANRSDPAADSTPRMLDALRAMDGLSPRPLVFANHPSRSARGPGDYAGHTPAELRQWNDTAPQVAVGMEGAPGHQAAALKAVAAADLRGRGYYEEAPTLGGFDEMTARVGGVWDSLLGEGRHWWISATSDSHRNHKDGGEDFWPGEYSKTYVFARHDGVDILDGLRHGRIFAVTGDLISSLDIQASAGRQTAAMGETLDSPRGAGVKLTIRLRDPAAPNAAGRTPEVSRVDVIMGEVKPSAGDLNAQTNPTTRVIRRFTARDWTRQGEVVTMTLPIPDVRTAAYIRVRGTNTAEMEPKTDPSGEDPWSDLWFYSNPIFIAPK